MRISFISDTHTKHSQITKDLPGGDILIHAGDLTSIGRPDEVHSFCKWFDSIDNYTIKIFIAGNHDFLFQNHSDISAQIVNSFKWITYLQDDFTTLVLPDPEKSDIELTVDNAVKVYGSPWQPEFHNWAFNLPRMGTELELVWNDIPDDTDILVTHGPPFGILDTVERRRENLGCELLAKRITKIKPKIHVFGHIHSGNGHYFDGHTHYINASVLGESYRYDYVPRTFDWDKESNELIEVK